MTEAEPGRRSAWADVALFGLVFVVHVTSPNVIVSDSRRSLAVADSIVHRRTLSIDQLRGRVDPTDYDVVEHDGHLYPLFPWGAALFAVPTVIAYDAGHALGWWPATEARAAKTGSDWPAQVLVTSAVVAATTLVIHRIALLELAALSRRRRRALALLSALAFAFGTAAWSTASRSMWQHGPSMLLLSLAALLALQSRARPEAARWLGLPLAAAYVVRPTNAIPLAAFGLWTLLCRRKQVLWFAAGAAAVLSLFVVVNLTTYGSLLPPYYAAQRVGSTPHLFEALAGNLISPGRGLLLFSPVLGLAAVGLILKRRARTLDGIDLVLAGCVVAHWLAISSFPRWWGGDAFGPRFFADMVPFLVVLSLPVVAALATAAPGPRRAVAAGACSALLAASVAINFAGAYLPSTWCWNVLPASFDSRPERLWSWRDPQFLRRGPIVRAGVVKHGCPADHR
ncbi:MAG: hypothetical protein LC792_24795 [Actinobacteria bacterium]|nr:hypothetical protein [Actinomycetota bacterium]